MIKAEKSALEKATAETRRATVKAARSAINDLRDEIEKVNEDLAHKDLKDLPVEKIEEIRSTYEQRIDSIANRNTEKLSGMRELLASIVEGFDQNSEIGQLDMVEAMETELHNLREQADTDESLVQLGLAIAVINHEFEAAIKMIRTQLKELRSWANVNNGLFPIYQDIRTNFDHLDAHLNLFTPLQRRLHRKRIDIKGKEIVHYVKTLFNVRFKRHDIELKVSQEFLDSTLKSFPSTIYPVFVNLIDNFVFWLSDKSGDRIISLGCKGSVYLIENNGSPINKRDAEAIFEQGFSRKPNGRGLGLYISKRTLGKEGMTLSLGPEHNHDDGVQFLLSWSEVNE